MSGILGAVMISLAAVDFMDLMASPPAGPIVGHALFDAALALAGAVWLWRLRRARQSGG